MSVMENIFGVFTITQLNFSLQEQFTQSHLLKMGELIRYNMGTSPNMIKTGLGVLLICEVIAHPRLQGLRFKYQSRQYLWKIFREEFFSSNQQRVHSVYRTTFTVQQTNFRRIKDQLETADQKDYIFDLKMQRWGIRSANEYIDFKQYPSHTERLIQQEQGKLIWRNIKILKGQFQVLKSCYCQY
eukprot:403364014